MLGWSSILQNKIKIGWFKTIRCYSIKIKAKIVMGIKVNGYGNLAGNGWGEPVTF